MSRDENIFSRWSSRKRAVAAEEETTRAPQAEVPAEPLPETVADPPEDEVAILERFGLPSPESLGPGDDFSGFMQSGVPEFLRRRALRRLWRSNPVLANVDGLNDYDEDFTSPEETMKVLKTAYKVGRGFLRDKSEDETDTEQDQAEAPDTPAPESAASSVRPPDDAPEVRPAPEVAAGTPDASEKGALDEAAHKVGSRQEDPEKPAPRVRRMRFET